MAANYRCFSVSAGADENIIPIIYKELQKEGYTSPKFQLHFVGFEAAAGTEFKINKNPMKVPSNGYFISPYDGERYLNIYSLTFDNGCSGLDIYGIY